MAKVSRGRHYDWLEETAYSEAFEDAQEHAVETLEEEARRRTMFGVELKSLITCPAHCSEA